MGRLGIWGTETGTMASRQGADPNDGESLYHACEIGADGVRMLLDAGAGQANHECPEACYDLIA